MKKILLICSVFVLLIMISACNYLFPSMPPFRYLDLYVTVADNSSVYNYIGIEFTIQNTSSNTITAIKAEFDFVDKDGAPHPPTGGSHQTIPFTDLSIAPMTTNTFVYSLDSLFYFDPYPTPTSGTTPTNKYFAKNFRIIEVQQDGAETWYDYVGAYPYPYDCRFTTNTTSSTPVVEDNNETEDNSTDSNATNSNSRWILN